MANNLAGALPANQAVARTLVPELRALLTEAEMSPKAWGPALDWIADHPQSRTWVIGRGKQAEAARWFVAGLAGRAALIRVALAAL